MNLFAWLARLARAVEREPPFAGPLGPEAAAAALGDIDGARRIRETRLASSILVDLHASEAELKAASAFVEKHEALHEPCRAAAGGRYSYLITPTGLGTCFTIRCACGGELDITDTDGW